MSSDSSRLRQRPRDRFGASQGYFSLTEAFAKLPDESTNRQGHMQKALFRHGETTTAIFEFQANSTIEEHSVDGEAIIHVLDGRLTIETDEQTHELGEDDLLLLLPQVSYNIRALEPTRMLMHVVLTRQKA